MGSFVVTVDFRVNPGCMPAFRALIDANARESCRAEPGCRRFDVLAPATDPERVFLYEIYDDAAAFDAHLKSAHYGTFNRESAALVSSKNVLQYTLLCEGSRANID